MTGPAVTRWRRTGTGRGGVGGGEAGLAAVRSAAFRRPSVRKTGKHGKGEDRGGEFLVKAICRGQKRNKLDLRLQKDRPKAERKINRRGERINGENNAKCSS